MRLEGRAAIVTGAGRGIGRAYAERFLREGAAVVIADIDEQQAKATEAELEPLGRTASVRVDVTDPASVDACAAATVERFGTIDVLVNNAALYGDWDMGDQSYEYLRTVFDVNLHGVWLMSRAVAPHMAARRYGRIVNQSSGAAYNYRHLHTGEELGGLASYNYQQTKWGVIGLTKFMAAQLGRFGITVNCIAPGVVDTEATRRAIPGDTLQAVAAQQAIPGVLAPDDLTGAATYFASEEARFVTGQTIVIDGGKHMPA